jgi:hypothetical protein
MNRITEKELQAIVDRLNNIMDKPRTTYLKTGDKYISQIGNYHLSFAYGGVALHQIVNDKGGVRDVLGTGHVTKRELAGRMYSYVAGLMDRKD